METIMNKSLCICGCCKRELPQEAFYMNQRTRTTDNYCKECRKANARRHRNQDKSRHSCISPWQYNHVIQRLWTL